MPSTLYHIPNSPWSLRAQRALSYHGIFPTCQQYTPFLTERKLRKAMGKKSGRLTVPVWLVNGKVYDDSWDIARRAEQNSDAPTLFPKEHLAAIKEANDLSDRIAAAGKNRVLVRILRGPGSVKSSLPPSLRNIPVFSKVLGTVILHLFCRKHNIHVNEYEAYAEQVRPELEALRAKIKQAERDGHITLLPQFSYADIALGISLQPFSALPDADLPQTSRDLMYDAKLAEEFADVLLWREKIHQKYGLLVVKDV